MIIPQNLKHAKMQVGHSGAIIDVDLADRLSADFKYWHGTNLLHSVKNIAVFIYVIMIFTISGHIKASFLVREIAGTSSKVANHEGKVKL